LQSTYETLGTDAYNIPLKYLQHVLHPNLLLQPPDETSEHLKHTLATCAFSTMSPCCSDEWTLVIVELDAGTEGRWRRMHLAGAAAARPTYDSPTPAHGPGSRPSERPYCCYSSAAAHSAAVVQHGATGDGVRRCGENGTARRHDEGWGAVGEGGATG
jgi:hypothetical protein